MAIASAVVALVARDGTHESTRAHAGAPGTGLAALPIERTLAPRLTLPVRYRTCVDLVGDGRDIPAGRCAPVRDDAKVAARAARIIAAGAPSAADAAHERALADLLWTDSAGKSLDRAISTLEAAVRLARRPVPLLGDLAAAYIVRAERRESPRDLLEAIEAAARALEGDRQNPVALFNLALAEERLGLVDVARKSWAAYERVDSTTPWSAEARRRAAALARVGEVSLAADLNSAPAEIATFAASRPLAAWLLGFHTALDTWATARLTGEHVTAARALAAADMLGDVLARRSGDSTLSMAARAARAAVDPARARRVAAAHRAFAAGLAAYERSHYVEAAPHFARAERVGVASPALAVWAAFFHGATTMLAGESAAAERTLRTVQRSPIGHATLLAARVQSAYGTMWLRGGRYEEALHAYRAARRQFTLAGEREQSGAMASFAAEAEFALGDADGAYRSLAYAHATLRTYRSSVRLHNLLMQALGRAAAADGLLRAAGAITDEDVAVAARVPSTRQFAVEAHIERARLLAALGAADAASADRRWARAMIPSLDAAARGWQTAHLQQVEAEATLRVAPARAAASLDSVVGYFQSRGNTLWVLPALAARAEARLAVRAEAAALTDLRGVVALLNEERRHVGRLAYRVTLLERARRNFDRLMMLRLGAGRADEALAYLERGRLSLYRPPTGKTPEARRPRAPRGAVAVEYALVGDTLVTWVVRDTMIAVVRSVVPLNALGPAIARARSSLELGVGSGEGAADLARLYDWLIRPVAHRLGAPGTPLVIVADGELATVPFAALRDSSGADAFLIDAHALRFSPTLADAGAPPSRRAGGATGGALPARAALLVADPALDERANPGLQRLTWARAEVERVASWYPGAKLLSAAQATPTAVARALRAAEVVHFAGHAVFDSDQPDRSYLVLAPDAASSDGRLVAAALAEEDLRRVRIVVLSACETMRAHAGRAGAVSGLAAALLAAGADGVVGAEWHVGDRATRALMIEFHRAYRALGDGPAALRTAQLALLASPDPTLRTPAAWAAFRYAGR